MAKDNLFMGYARGKVGSVVFSRSNGMQIARAHNGAPKNPRTTGQIFNRIIVSTLGQAYSALKTVCNHSFEGITTGMPCMQEFMRLNQAQLRAELPGGFYNGKGEKNHFLPNMLQVSSGSLSEPGYSTTVGGSGLGARYTTIGLEAFQNVTSPTSITYGMVADALGVNMGDQITIIRVLRSGGPATSDMKFTPIFNRFILWPAAAEGQTEEYTEAQARAVPFLATSTEDNITGEINRPNHRNLTRNLVFNVSVQDDSTTVFIDCEELDVVSLAVIRSVKSVDKWLYSPAFLSDLSFDTSAWGITAAVNSWTEQASSNFVSADYLDNANEFGDAPLVPGGDEANG